MLGCKFDPAWVVSEAMSLAKRLTRFSGFFPSGFQLSFAISLPLDVNALGLINDGAAAEQGCGYDAGADDASLGQALDGMA